MKLPLLIALVFLPFGTLNAETVNSHSLPTFSNSKDLINQQSCFVNEAADYKSWLKSLQINNAKFNIDRFNKFSSEAKYDRYKENLDCYSFTYFVDGIRVKGYVVKPKQKLESYLSQRPVIIYNRGGNNTQAHTLNFLSLFSYHMPLAEKGYIVISSQYRGADVWPKGSKVNVGRDEFGGKDVDDVLGLYSIISGMNDADVSRIGMFGWSRGGMMTYIALTKSSWIKAAVVGGGPTDLVKQADDRPEMDKNVFSRLIPHYSDNKLQELQKRSAIYWADKFPKSIPILIMHGGADNNVPPSDATNIARLLEEYDIPHKLLILPGASHGMREHWDVVISEVTNWFEKNL